jgi:hypothetical protein
MTRNLHNGGFVTFLPCDNLVRWHITLCDERRHDSTRNAKDIGELLRNGVL